MKRRYYYYRKLGAAGIAFFSLLASGEARTEDEVLGSLQLRGGFDSNPTLAAGGKGGALGGVEAAVVAGRSAEDYTAAVTGEASYTRYGEPSDAPVRRLRGSFDIANKDQNEVSLKSSTSVTSFDNYDTRSFDAVESVRAQYVGGPVRPFVTVEGRYSELNESNLLLGDFLPQPEAFLRGTIIPGVSVKKSEWETGTSVNLSMTRYRDKFDLFGFQRDNERVQPFLFLRYDKDSFSLFANVSYFYGDWHDADFSDVRKNLYEINVTYTGEPFSYELSAKRTVEETTFPLSPATADANYYGKIARKLDPKTSVALYGRYLEKNYLDSPFVQRTRTVGFQTRREISDKVSAGFEIAYSQMKPILGADAEETVAFVSLTQRFGGDDKKRAEGNASAR